MTNPMIKKKLSSNFMALPEQGVSSF